MEDLWLEVFCDPYKNTLLVWLTLIQKDQFLLAFLSIYTTINSHKPTLTSIQLWQSHICWDFFFYKFIYLFIYLWLCWVFVSVRGLSLVVASRGHSSSRCAGLSLSRPLLLRSTGSRCAGSVVVPHGPSCSAACGIFPEQGTNPCPLHWQADS